MLKIDHFTKTYGEKKAVDDLTLHIQRGEIYGFIGHNGAGKTTTLKSVAGIMQFDSGEILIDGISIQKDPIACKKKMAYIPDNPDLYEFMTGMQYLNFVGDVFGIPAELRKQRIQALVPVLIPLFISAFRRADELAMAMECRCYRGGDGRTRLKVLRCTKQDYIDLAVCIVCFVLILSSRLVFPNF